MEDRSAIKQEGLITKSFQCYKGVKQGCMLLYADVLVLFSKTPNDLQALLNQLNLYADNNGLTVSIEKTKVL